MHDEDYGQRLSHGLKRPWSMRLFKRTDAFLMLCFKLFLSFACIISP